MWDVLLEWVRAHGPLGIFTVIAVENLGLPGPTGLALIVAADMIRVGRMSYAEAVGLITLAHLVGACAGYGIGRAGDSFVMQRLQSSRHMRRASQWLHKWYQRRGSATVFGARLIGQVRPWASIAAGLGEVGIAPFILWTAVGSAIYAVIALELTRAGFRFWDTYPNLRLGLVIVVFVIFYGIAIFAAIRALIANRRSNRDAAAVRGVDDQ